MNKYQWKIIDITKHFNKTIHKQTLTPIIYSRKTRSHHTKLFTN